MEQGRKRRESGWAPCLVSLLASLLARLLCASPPQSPLTPHGRRNPPRNVDHTPAGAQTTKQRKVCGPLSRTSPLLPFSHLFSPSFPLLFPSMHVGLPHTSPRHPCGHGQGRFSATVEIHIRTSSSFGLAPQPTPAYTVFHDLPPLLQLFHAQKRSLDSLLGQRSEGQRMAASFVPCRPPKPPY